MASKTERRYSFLPETKEQFRVKRVENDLKSRKIRGYGSVFNQKSKIITEWYNDEYRTFYEVVEPQAFDKLKNNNWDGIDVILSVNHRFDEVLARLANSSLVLGVDDYGLYYEAELLETALGEDILRGVATGLYYESSFQFIISGERWEKDNETGLYIRYISEIETLIDVTVAKFRGAYSNTDIQVIDGKRIAIQEYQDDDIAVARIKLNELLSAETRTETPVVETQEIKTDIQEDKEYLQELELDSDKMKLL